MPIVQGIAGDPNRQLERKALNWGCACLSSGVLRLIRVSSSHNFIPSMYGRSHKAELRLHWGCSSHVVVIHHIAGNFTGINFYESPTHLEKIF